MRMYEAMRQYSDAYDGVLVTMRHMDVYENI